jgi:hypothetical protein
LYVPLRLLASISMTRAQPPLAVEAALRHVLEQRLEGFAVRDVEMLLRAMARIYKASKRFDDVLDGAVHRLVVLHEEGNLTGQQYSGMLWAFARIGLQSPAVEAMLELFCSVLAKEVRRFPHFVFHDC